jgi:hypothetical protein
VTYFSLNLDQLALDAAIIRNQIDNGQRVGADFEIAVVAGLELDLRGRRILAVVLAVALPSSCFTAIIRKCTSAQKIAFGRSISGVTRIIPTSIRLSMQVRYGSKTRPNPLGLIRSHSRPMKRSPQQILRLDAHHGGSLRPRFDARPRR